jgi:hypothetical protein
MPAAAGGGHPRFDWRLLLPVRLLPVLLIVLRALVLIRILARLLPRLLALLLFALLLLPLLLFALLLRRALVLIVVLLVHGFLCAFAHAPTPAADTAKKTPLRPDELPAITR